jgi:hypothetical protein
MAKRVTEDDYLKKLQDGGVTIVLRLPNEVYVAKGDRHVRLFFNGDDRFYDATKLDEHGSVLRVRDHTLRSMAAVDRYLEVEQPVTATWKASDVDHG